MNAAIDALAELLHGRSIAVLTGAGCSTESGIPDYRGEGTRKRARNPVKIDVFLRDPAARQRYWARSFLGWPKFAAARPNDAHRALASLERAGCVRGLITQNVDGLHQAAGSQRVIELHGTLAEVRCGGCGLRVDRRELQRTLESTNADLLDDGALAAPDGDADVAASTIERFRQVDCAACGGFLRPDVVFFGETVPADRVERGYALIEGCEALLVVGSSLAVFSGYRFVRRASDRGTPIAIVNLGESRGTAHAALSVEGKAGEVLPRLVERLAHDRHSLAST